ncbi:helix-turn-helix domain-containing protein [Clostridium sp.]|uniref:helix-turn-helix domain-containing protein n=1 Tax=Clostridium sp. TaxID=1506 RepID=UPI00284F1641|nr:helix-turn-helix domain-containing protein [Clostridium sp.]MDR3598777.1 helix-turn-helix domain-containing protein [Clostridium sp.]
MKENPTYYAIIPANVRYDEKITLGAKMMYGEITALSSKEGFCWASNNYFAKLYKVHKNTIQNWIKSLKDSGYIRLDTKQSQSGSERKIFLIPQSQKFVIGLSQ